MLLQVQLFFPVIYIIATVFITIVPMVASPVETGIKHHFIIRVKPNWVPDIILLFWEISSDCA